MGHISWTARATTNLRSIHDYIAGDSAFYAKRFIRALIHATRKLESFPRAGRKVPELPDHDFREVTYSGYRIIYRVLGTEDIEVLAVLHGRQDLEKALERDWELG